MFGEEQEKNESSLIRGFNNNYSSNNNGINKETFNTLEYTLKIPTCPILISGIERIISQTEKAVGFKMKNFDKIFWVPKKSLAYKNGNFYTQSWILSKFN